MKADDCRVWRERIGALVLGQLDPDQRASTEAHLDGCPDCRAEADALAPVAALLSRVDPETTRTEPRPAPAPRRPHRPADRGRAPRQAPQARPGGVGARRCLRGGGNRGAGRGGDLRISGPPTGPDDRLPRPPRARLGAGHARAPALGERRQRPGPRVSPGDPLRGLAASPGRHPGHGRLVPLRLRRRERRGRAELGGDRRATQPRSASAPVARPSSRRCRLRSTGTNDVLNPAINKEEAHLMRPRLSDCADRGAGGPRPPRSRPAAAARATDTSSTAASSTTTAAQAGGSGSNVDMQRDRLQAQPVGPEGEGRPGDVQRRPTTARPCTASRSRGRTATRSSIGSLARPEAASSPWTSRSPGSTSSTARSGTTSSSA